MSFLQNKRVQSTLVDRFESIRTVSYPHTDGELGESRTSKTHGTLPRRRSDLPRPSLSLVGLTGPSSTPRRHTETRSVDEGFEDKMLTILSVSLSTKHHRRILVYSIAPTFATTFDISRPVRNLHRTPTVFDPRTEDPYPSGETSLVE